MRGVAARCGRTSTAAAQRLGNAAALECEGRWTVEALGADLGRLEAVFDGRELCLEAR